MSAKSPLSPRASTSASILWVPTAVFATLDTSCQDITALVSWDKKNKNYLPAFNLFEFLLSYATEDFKR